MQWITQAALGAAIGEAMLGKKLGNRAMLWGMAIALFPQLDYLLGAIFPDWLDLWVIDGLGQSAIFIGLLAFYGGRKMATLHKKPKLAPQETSLFILAVLGAVVLYKALTVDGVWLFWPLSFGKICYPVLPEIDLLFLLPLVYGLIKLSLHQTKKEQPLRRNWLIRSTAISGGVLLLSLMCKLWTLQAFKNNLAAKHGISGAPMLAAPCSWNRLMWRCVVRTNEELWVGYRSVFQPPNSPVRWTVYAQRPESLNPIADKKETRAVLHKTRGWYIARPNKKGGSIADFSHAEARVWGAKKTMVDSRPATTWMIDMTRENSRLRVIPGQSDSIEMFERTVQRIFGKHDAWEANPRLAGISGSLPESLMVFE